jgi:hypothetical protein
MSLREDMLLRFSLAVAVLGSAAGAQASPRPILREVRLVADTIRLGQPWPGAKRLWLSPRDSVAALPRGSFGWAEDIRIHRDATGVVRQIEFSYGPHRDINAMLRDYRGSISHPADSSSSAAGGVRRETWVWRDGQTEFALVRLDPAQNGVQASSTLTDRSHR